MFPENAFNLFVDPATQEPLAILKVAEDGINIVKYLKSSANSYPIIDGIPHLLHPPILLGADKKSQDFYDGELNNMSLHLTFFT